MSSSVFPFPQAIFGGVITVNVFAILASFALFTVFVRIAWLAVLAVKNAEQPAEFVFFKTQLGIYAANILCADLIIAGSGLINVSWLPRRGIVEGGLCIAQAITMQIGNVAAAYFTVAISVHTFVTLVLRVRQSVSVTAAVLILGWIIASVVGILPQIRASVYGASGIMCAVKPDMAKSQFLVHLLPIYLAAMLSTIMYSLIFLVLRGTLVVRGGFKLELDPDRRISRSNLIEEESYHQFVVAIAKSILWFPVAYVLLLVPYSTTQMLSIAGFTVSFEVQILAAVCWFLIGIVNVLLLYNTFRVLGPVLTVRSQGVSNYSRSNVEKGVYSPSFMCVSLSEKQKMAHHKSISNASSVMSNTSSRPLVRHSGSSDMIGRAISSNEELSKQIVSIPERAAPRLTSIQEFGHNNSEILYTNSISLPVAPRQTQGSVPIMSPVPPSAMKRNKQTAPMPRESFGAHSPVDPPPQKYPFSRPTKPSVPEDLSDEEEVGSRATITSVDGYPRSSYFETYYGQNYIPSVHSASPKLRPLLLQAGQR